MKWLLSFANRYWVEILVFSITAVALAFAWQGYIEGQFKMSNVEHEAEKNEKKRREDQLKRRSLLFKQCDEQGGVPVLGYGFAIVCLRPNSGCIFFASMPEP